MTPRRTEFELFYCRNVSELANEVRRYKNRHTDKACLEIAIEKERQGCGGESRDFKYRDW